MRRVKMKCGELLNKGSKLLQTEGITVPRLEAEVLLAFAWGRERVDLLIFSDDFVPPQIEKSFMELLSMRETGMPVAYLIGEKEFMSLGFHVDQSVLIPRPETELLVERILAHLAKFPGNPLIADVGTGSGAIAVSTAFYAPGAKLVATDISSAALRLAERNALLHSVSPRVEFLQGDLLLPVLEKGFIGRGCAVAANLPYIPTARLGDLPRDLLHEPQGALDGGEDGLDYYRRLLPQAASFLATGGLIVCEVDSEQTEELATLMQKQAWLEIEILKDYSGRERLVTGVKD